MEVELSNRIFDLGTKVDDYIKIKDNKLAEQINLEIKALDSLLEFCKVQEELYKIYNNIKKRFFKNHTDERIYCSKSREIEIENISKQVNEFVEITEYIDDNINNQETEIDELCDHMIDIERDTIGALHELQRNKSYLDMTMGMARGLSFIAIVVFGIIIFNLLR